MYVHWRTKYCHATMSSPSKQSTSRRLPPLPGIKRNISPHPQHLNKTGVTSPTYAGGKTSSSSPLTAAHRDMVITGQQLTNGSHSNKPSVSSSEGIFSSSDMNQESVSSYLSENPDYLEKYILTNISTEQLQVWVVTKKQQQNTKHIARPNINGDVSQRHNNNQNESPAKWKGGVHADKRKMLQDLTREIHKHPHRSQVLSELVGCVAAALNSDGSNLYLVDENGDHIYHIKPNSDFTKSSSTCVKPIGPGSIVAAYVAQTRQSLRLKGLKGDSRFPEGIGFGGEIAHSVLAEPIIDSMGQLLGVVEFFRTKEHQSFKEEDEEVADNMLFVSELMIKCHEVNPAVLDTSSSSAEQRLSLQLVSNYMVWAMTALFYAELSNSDSKLYHTMTKQRKLNEFLLTVTKSIFQDIVSMDTVIMKIMNFAQKLVNADRASLFLLDTQTKELYARIFDVGNGMGAQALENATHKEIRFPMDKGVAGHVASTGQILNIPDAYADDRFNRQVDLQTGYRTKTILCMPIYIRGNIIGVVQMVNKHQGVFTTADEESFQTFAVYCGLALHHAKLYDKIRRSEQKYKVALEVLSYHGQASEEEIEALNQKTQPNIIPELVRYDFSPWSVMGDDKPRYVIYMFKDLFEMQRFDMTNLIKFTLTVRKNYRNVPYHNWAHAFSVAHAVYTVIKTTENAFTPLEAIALYTACLCHDLDHRGKTNSFLIKNAALLASIYTTSTMEHHHFNQTVSILQCLALFVGCLCHDVDHRGYTNQFMVKSASPLAAIYSTSTMEQHHFNHTITILQQEGHNIFKHLTSEEYKLVLGDIKHCILATDLALFFPNKAKLRGLVDQKSFKWDAKDHKHLLMGVFMTASDLCSMYKPWETQLQLVHVIMEEFWLQGDQEKAAGNTPIPMMDRTKADELPQSQGDEEKAKGETPPAMMDRDRQHELPSLEVGFLVGICLPCYELLAAILPQTKPMVEGANANLKRWQELADKQKEEEDKRTAKEEKEKAAAKTAGKDNKPATKSIKEKK